MAEPRNGRRWPAPADEPIRPRRGAQTSELSYAQQRLWFLHQLVAGSPFYTESAAVHLRGRIDPGVLQRSLDEVVARHEVLRTTYHEEGGRPVQAIAAAVTVPLVVADLSGRSPGDRAAEIERRSTASARHTFDLTTGPLLRAELLRLGPSDWVLLLAIHHIACDGWSTTVFSDELSAIYAAFAAGRPSPLPALPIQYADFATWQRRALAGDLLDGQIAYWREQLAGLPALALPTDRPRPAVFTYEGEELRFDVPPVVAGALQRLSQQEGATLFMTLLTAFATVLHRHARQDDVVVGCPVANRTRRELEGLIGFFVNTLVLRLDTGGRPTFRQLLARVRRTALQAFDHQDVPFERLVDELHPDRDLSRNPLFQVIFQLRSPPGTGRPRQGPFDELPVRRTIAKFDLRLDFVESSTGLQGIVEYSTDLFDRPRVERLVGHLQTALASMARRPDETIDDLALVGPAEARRLAAWGRVLEPSGVATTLWPAFEDQVARAPSAPAVLADDRELSYGELHSQAVSLAAALAAAGIAPGAVVGIDASRRPDTVIAILAVVAAGAAYVPLDPGYPDERLGELAGAAGVEVVVADGAVAARFAALGLRTVPAGSAPPDAAAGRADLSARAAPGPDDAAYVMFTSGSTGRPKGVVVPHRGVVRLVRDADYLAFGPDEVGLLLAPLTFDAATLEIWGPLLNGGRLAIAPDGPFDPEELGRLVRRHGVTTLWLTAGAFHQVVETRLDALRGVRQLLSGGDVLPPAAVARLLAELPGCRLVNGYGPTENTTFTTCHDVTGDTASGSVPIGRPIHGTHVVVVDELLRPAPLGVPGELCIGGDGLAWGYLGDPRLTAERFVPDPFVTEPGARMYRSGDLVAWRDDGELRFLGRLDRQLKVRGFRVEPGEIEAALVQHALVDAAVVVGRDDGSRGRRLVAYVVPASTDGTPAASAREGDGAGSRVLVDDWRDAYDRLYDGPGSADPSRDFRGWTSSATGEPIPEPEMAEWLDATVERILALRPRRVLEIGAGTGLVLFRVAPATQRYVATDLSPTAIGRLRRLVAERGLADTVELVSAPADAATGVPTGPFDVVVINSVVQYFPSLVYLDAVLDRALAALAPGGAVFVGDVRNLPLLDAFHVELVRDRAPDDPPAAIAARARRQRRLERELVVDPFHFEALVGREARVTAVDVRWKRAAARNEMARFRYDVVISTAPIGGSAPAPVVVDWDGDGWDRVGALLAAAPPPAVVVRNVPNERVAAAVAVERIVADGDGASAADIAAAIRDAAAAAVDPERFHDLAARHGLVARARPAPAPACMDVELVAPDVGALRWRRPVPPVPVEANEPVAAVVASDLGPVLRQHLTARLPDFMLPATFVAVDAIPLTRNGKIDRAALPVPDDERPDVGDAYVAPRTASEARLAQIWADVIGIDRVGVHDNFFELGGDSILCLQIIARARAAGLALTVTQLFERQTVAELAQVAGRAPGADAAAEQGPQSGAATLTPAQRWLLDDAPDGVDHFNQSVLLEVPAALDARLLDGSLAALARHHDALRLRFRRVGGSWSAAYADPETPVPLTEHDLVALDDGALGPEIERRAAAAQAGLDIGHGPLLRAELFRAGPHRPARLLLAVHHLAVDGVSWRILLEDLWTAYGQLGLGRSPSLPAKTTSLGRWAAATSAYADEPAVAATADAWAAIVDPADVILPTDGVGDENLVGTAATLTATVPAPETAALLTRVPAAAGGSGIEDLLLACLGRTLAIWRGRDTVVVDLEGHGHEEVVPGVDVSRTVGWFTAIAPIRLTVPADGDAVDAVPAVVAMRRARPGPAVAFGALRHLSSDEPTRRRLGALAPRQLAFNYLGQFGRREQAGAIRGAAEDADPMRAPSGARRYLIEVDVVVAAGELSFTWTFAPRFHRRETMATLAERVVGDLVALATDAHVGSAEVSPAFPASPLVADELAAVLSRVASGTERAP